MEDDLNFFPNGRRPQFFSRQPRKLIFGMQLYVNPTKRNMEDDLNFFENGRQHKRNNPKTIKSQNNIFLKLEDYLNFFLMEDDFNSRM